MSEAEAERGAPRAGRLDRALGIARSALVYHGQPWRVWRARRHFRAFLGPGDLAFDIGAHLGNRTACFARLGARVVALEPNPDLVTWLRRAFRTHPRVTIVASAVGAAPGTLELHPSPRTPTVSTTSAAWRARVEQTRSFQGIQWERPITVPATTLDALVARFGVPRFCKIDVEGAEAEILAGLSRPLPALSLEYLPAAIEVALAAVARLNALGDHRFNVSIGERMRLEWPTWQDGATMLAWLQARAPDERSGDVYARLESP